MNPLQDVFISYGRADSKQFAKKLNDHLVELGYTVWFDFEDIPLGVDYQKQIDDGIEKADNFLFLISPHAVNSAYCSLEIKLALKRKKRIIPLLHVEMIDRDTWQNRNPEGTDEQWADYQAAGKHSSFDNMHPEIGKINWVYFREGIDDFEPALSGLLSLLELEKDYVQRHTVLLNQALAWERNQKQTRYLLTGEERQQAEVWLAIRFPDKQPPVWPTDLHYEYITESIKNANNLMTQVFLSHGEDDAEITEQVRRTLMRAGMTTWSYRADIEYGSDFQAAIARGIEQADNVVFLMSSYSLKSDYCRQELDLAFQLNKRLIILLVGPVDDADVPVFIRNRQYIDLTDNTIDADYCQDEDDLIRVLKQDAKYYNEHKLLLTKALKWERQQFNPCILLQGYELQQALVWWEVAKTKDENGPTVLQEEFFEASNCQTAVVSPDVFISYSRADSDFARRLNNGLQRQRKRTWFDQESIASGTDFQQEIYKGIETSNVFLFVLSPRAVKSPYCTDEVDYAVKLNKRVVTVLHRSVNPADLHPELAKVQWIDFMANDGEFDTNFEQLLRTLDMDQVHLKYHTQLLMKAIEWDKKQRREDVLLRGNNLVEAEQWIVKAMGKQPSPTELQGDYVTMSRALVERYRQQATKQQRMVIGGLASLLLVAVVGGATAAWKWQAANRATRQAKLNQARSLGLYSLTLSNEGKDLKAWLEAIRAGTILQKYEASQAEVLNSLQQVLLKGIETYSLTGHTQKTTSVSFSPDGTTVVSSSRDNTIKLWNVETRTEIASFTGHDDEVTSVSFSPDGTTVVSGSEDNTIKLWNVKTGQEIGNFTGHDDEVTSVSFSPDGTIVVSGSEDNTIKLWDVETKAEIRSLTGHNSQVTSVSFSPDGTTVVSGSEDNTIKLWDAETGNEIRSLVGHDSSVLSVSFSPDGRTLASGSEDNTIKLWNVATGKEIDSLYGHNSDVTGVSFSPDNQTLASGSWDHTVKLWDVETHREIRSLYSHHSDFTSVRFSPDGQTLASGSGDHTIKLWNVRPDNEIRSLIGHNAPIWGVHFSPDGTTVTSGSRDRTIKLWNVQTGQEIRSFTGHDDVIWRVNFSPDGQTLASGSWDRTIKLWHVQTGQEIRSLTGHNAEIWSVSFDPAGQMLASGSSDKTIKLWHVQTGQEIRSLTGHDGLVMSVSFSPDGQILASGGEDNHVKLWDVATGQEIHSLTGHDNLIMSVSFSPDGQMLASGSRDDTVKLWNVKTGKEIRSFIGHDSEVTSVSFNSDGRTLASSSRNHTIKLWNVETGENIRTLTGLDSPVNSIDFSPDDRIIVSGSKDATIKLWELEDLSLDSLLIRGCDWVRSYVAHNPVEISDEDQALCDRIKKD